MPNSGKTRLEHSKAICLREQSTLYKGPNQHITIGRKAIMSDTSEQAFLFEFIDSPFQQIIEALGKVRGRKAREILEGALEKAIPGQRNEQCYNMGKRYRSEGFPIDFACDMAREYSRRVPQDRHHKEYMRRGDFTEKEALGCIKSAYKYRHPR